MTIINILRQAGSFAENKDSARDIRINIISTSLDSGEDIMIDFQGVEGATQSFIHALISDLIRERGPEVLEKISFKNCNESIRKIINIVAAYVQESI